MNHKKVSLLLVLLTLFACSPRQTPSVAPTVGQPEVPTLVPYPIFASPEPTAVVCDEETREYVRYSGNLWVSFREIYDKADLALRVADASRFSKLWKDAGTLFGDFNDHSPYKTVHSDSGSALLIDYYVLESETFLDFTDALDTGVGGDFVEVTLKLAKVDASYQTLHSMYLTLATQCNVQ